MGCLALRCGGSRVLSPALRGAGRTCPLGCGTISCPCQGLCCCSLPRATSPTTTVRALGCLYPQPSLQARSSLVPSPLSSGVESCPEQMNPYPGTPLCSCPWQGAVAPGLSAVHGRCRCTAPCSLCKFPALVRSSSSGQQKHFSPLSYPLAASHSLPIARTHPEHQRRKNPEIQLLLLAKASDARPVRVGSQVHKPTCLFPWGHSRDLSHHPGPGHGDGITCTELCRGGSALGAQSASAPR